ncbi:MAG: hypothetical protein U1E45_05395 [Geminicoccaceae bacterium]
MAWAILALTGGMSVGSSAALAQDTAPVSTNPFEAARQAPLEITVTPYVWAMALNGTVGVGDVHADVDLSFSDILQHLNGALMMSAEFRKGPFSLLSDTLVARLEGDANGDYNGDLVDASLDVNAKMTQVMQQLAGTYRFADVAFANSEPGRPFGATFDVYGGARYTYLNTQVQARLNASVEGPFGQRERQNQRQATQSADKHWVDPIIGLRSIWNLGGRFSAVVAGDIGGISTSDQYSWEAWGLVGYRFSIFSEGDSNFLIGYRALHQKYQDGSGNRRFDWDVTMHGPITGLKITF